MSYTESKTNKMITYLWKSMNLSTGESLHKTAGEMLVNIDSNGIGYLVVEIYNPINDEFNIINLLIDIYNMDIDSPPQGINIDDQIVELQTAIRGGKHVQNRAKNNKGRRENSWPGTGSKMVKRLSS